MARSLLSVNGRLVILITVLLRTQSFVHGQDLTFSTIFFNKSLLNPAYVGQSGHLSMGLIHRAQWTSLPERGLNDVSLSSFHADISCPKWNLAMGIQAQVSEEGAGRYRNTIASYTVSKSFVNQYPRGFFIKGLRGLNHQWSVGLQVGVGQKAIDFSRFTFGDQYDPFLGIISDRSAVLSLSTSSSGYMDINAGMLWRSQFRKEKGFFSIGAAMYHINSPNETFLFTENRIPQRLSISSFYNFRIDGNVYRKRSTYVSFGVVNDRHLNIESNQWKTLFSTSVVTLGGIFQNGKNEIGGNIGARVGSNAVLNALLINGTMQLNDFLILTSTVEINTSDFTINQSGFTTEFGLIFNISNAYLCKCNSPRDLKCPFDEASGSFNKSNDKNSLVRSIP